MCGLDAFSLKPSRVGREVRGTKDNDNRMPMHSASHASLRSRSRCGEDDCQKVLYALDRVDRGAAPAVSGQLSRDRT